MQKNKKLKRKGLVAWWWCGPLGVGSSIGNCCWWLSFCQHQRKSSSEPSEKCLSVDGVIGLVCWHWLVSLAMMALAVRLAQMLSTVTGWFHFSLNSEDDLYSGCWTTVFSELPSSGRSHSRNFRYYWVQTIHFFNQSHQSTGNKIKETYLRISKSL